MLGLMKIPTGMKNVNQSEVCPYVELVQVPAQLVQLCNGRTAEPVWKLLGLVRWGHQNGGSDLSLPYRVGIQGRSSSLCSFMQVTRWLEVGTAHGGSSSEWDLSLEEVVSLLSRVGIQGTSSQFVGNLGTSE